MDGMRINQINLIEAASRIASLHDDTLLTPSEAAVFLKSSSRTLERWRAEGFGPKFRKPNDAGPNQKVTYRLGDLKIWSHGTIQNFITEGLFNNALPNMYEPQPYWTAPNGKGLIGRIYDDTEDEFFSRLHQSEVIWITPAEALETCWLDEASQEKLGLIKHYQGLLKVEGEKMAALEEKGELAVELRKK